MGACFKISLFNLIYYLRSNRVVVLLESGSSYGARANNNTNTNTNRVHSPTYSTKSQPSGRKYTVLYG